MAEDKQEKPKMIIDDDWKNQAQAEKEKLAEQVEGPEGAEGGAHELPAASFTTLVGGMVTQVFMALGGYEDPRTKRRLVDLEVAKHYIDLLVVLEQKTKGNLDDKEKKVLDQAMYECRMQYVQMAQRVGGV